MNPEPILAIVVAALFLHYVWHHLTGYKVLGISDGDGFRIKVGYGLWKKKVQKIRIYGSDAPEMDQPFGPEAKAALSKLLIGKTVTITHVNDTHDRWACKVSLWLLDVSAWQVLWGWAHNYREFGGRYRWQQAFAQFFRLGLWKHGSKNVVPPWVHRERQRTGGKVVSFKESSKQKRKTK